MTANECEPAMIDHGVNPDEYADSEFSGFGSELVFETPGQADWAVRALARLLSNDVLLAHGKFGDIDPLSPGARVPLGGPINGDPASPIRFVAIGVAAHYSPTFKLASGQAALIDTLAGQGAFPVTDPSRRAVV